MTEKKWTALSFAAMAAAIICELLPYGAVLRFMGDSETGEINRHTYSYFSLTPYGYANFGPLITAVLSTALVIMLLVLLFAKKSLIPLRTAALVISFVALGASLMPLLMLGLEYYSLLGGGITVLLLLAVIFECIAMKKLDKPDDAK